MLSAVEMHDTGGVMDKMGKRKYEKPALRKSVALLQSVVALLGSPPPNKP
jgi:hypothetical protein